MRKWHRLKGEDKDAAESTDNSEAKAADRNIKRSLRQDTNLTSKTEDQEEFYRNCLGQQCDAIQQVLSENSERILQAMVKQMMTFQTKVLERQVEKNPDPQVESRAQVQPPQLVELSDSGLASTSPIAAQITRAASFSAITSGSVADFAKPQELTIQTDGTGEEIGKSLESGPCQDDRTKRISRGKKSLHFRASRRSLGSMSKDFSIDSCKAEEEDWSMGKGVFADADTIKAQLRKEMTEPPYDVTNFYKTTGYAQFVARSPTFESATLLIIAFNAFWISVDVDLNDATLLVDASPTFQIMDNVFCLYFFVEWLFRYLAFARKSDSLKDRWFVFDSLMCILMVMETWVLSFVVVVFSIETSDSMGDASLLKGLRLVRLIRMARVMRLCNALPELMVVIKGMAVATRAVSCTVLLMLLIIYVFAVLFRQLTDGTSLGKEHFPTVPVAMRFLLLHGTMPDVEEAAITVWNENFIFAMLFLFFILVITITIMNMLVGVLVGVVNTVAIVEKEQLTINFVKEHLLTILKKDISDEDLQHGLICRDKFVELITNSQAVRAFDMMGVDVVGLVDLGDFIFSDGKKLEFTDFMEVILQLRGTNQATVKDIVDLRKFISLEFAHMMRSMGKKPLHAEAGAALDSSGDAGAAQHHIMPCITATMSLKRVASRHQKKTILDAQAKAAFEVISGTNSNSTGTIAETAPEDDGKKVGKEQSNTKKLTKRVTKTSSSLPMPQ